MNSSALGKHNGLVSHQLTFFSLLSYSTVTEPNRKNEKKERKKTVLLKSWLIRHRCLNSTVNFILQYIIRLNTKMGSQYSPLNSPRTPWTPRSKATSACWLAIISLALSTFALFSTIHASTLLHRGSGKADGGIRKAILRSILLTADDVDVSSKSM